MDEAVGPRRKRKKSHIGDRVSAEELFGNAYLIPCNNPESLLFNKVRFEVPKGPDT